MDKEAWAYQFLEELRWGGVPTCTHCGNPRAYYLTPANRWTRKTRTGRATPRRIWKCAACRLQFSVLTGTFLSRTKVPLWTWVAVIQQVQSLGAYPTVRCLADQHGVGTTTAQRMLTWLRQTKDDPVLNALRNKIN